MVASLNVLRSVPSSSIFWKSLRSIGTSSLYVWENSPVKPSGLGHLFVGRCKITDSISVLMISLFKLSIYSWFSFGGLYVSRTCPFLPACRIYWHIIVHSIFFFSLQYQLLCSSFLILFVFSLFTALWTWPEVCKSCLSFQRTGSWFYWLFYFFFLSLFYLFFLWSLLFPSFY